VTRAPLLSFDIDGTLEIGDPPGIIPIALVRRAKAVVWHRLGMLADFTVLKHRLADLRARFDAAHYYHVGDTELDEQMATLAGFRFLRANAVAHRAWGLELFPD